MADWEAPFTLQTPEGDLPINQAVGTTGWWFQLNPALCTAQLPVRSTDDDISQQDGRIPHRRFRSGYDVHLGIELFTGTDADELDCAGGADLTAMLDLLGLHINSMIRTGLVAGESNARLIWTPAGGTSPGDDRFFDRIQLSAAPAVSFDGALGGYRVDVDFDTPFPYYLGLEVQTVLSDTGAVTITNEGNTDVYPVVQVYGPVGGAASFAYLNESTVDLSNVPLEVLYNAALPGGDGIVGSDYVEFDHFRGTAFLNGNQARRLAGVDFRYSTFFTLVPGDNLVAIVGAVAVLIHNHAYA